MKRRIRETNPCVLQLAAQPATDSSTAASAPPTLSPAITTTKLSAPVSVASPLTRTARSRPSLSSPGTASTDAAESNPWLTLGAEEGTTGALSRKNNKASFGKDQSALAKSTAKADRARAKQADAREAERDDARVELDLSAESSLAGATAAGKQGKKAAAKGRHAERAQVGGALAVPAEGVHGAEGASSDEELNEEEINAQRGKGPAAFRQRELVKEAFANDDVVAVRGIFLNGFGVQPCSRSVGLQEFEEEKRKEIERDAPREEDNTLPGWVRSALARLSQRSADTPRNRVHGRARASRSRRTPRSSQPRSPASRRASARTQG